MIHVELDINNNLLDNFNDIKELSEEEKQTLLNTIDIEDALKNKNKNHVINYILISQTKNKEKALEQLKREKVFSLNINSKNQFTIKILDFLIKNNNVIKCNQTDIEYLQSKKNLSLISEDIYEISQKIRKEISDYGNSFVRDILFIVDMHFFRKMNNMESFNISVENLSEICSFLIYLYSQINKEHIITEKTFSSVYVLNDKKMDNLISDAYTIINFQNLEKFIDNFDYICIKEQKNLIVKNKDSSFEKSRRYGDFYSNMQRTISMTNTAEKYSNALSFDVFIEKLSKNFESFFEFSEHPIKRYIFKFPMFEEIKEFILKDEYFLEEISELEEIQKEYLIEDMMNFKISKILTIRDLMIIKRIYKIIAFLNSKFLYSILEQDNSKKQTIYNSWIKAFKHENLKNTLVPFIGDDKAKEFILEFSWLLKSNKKLDLQYTPLIQFDDYYFPMNIFISSNLFRNSLMKNNIRIHKNNNDQISKAIFTLIKRNFKNVELELKYKNNGFHGDYDVIAYIENVIYIFECKNIITPVDLHELRTTYDNFKYGLNIQLTKGRNALSNEDFIAYINKRLSWNISSNVKIVSCLVLGTRMFNGYTDGINHVISFHELFNFLDNGKIEIRNNDKIEEINLWENEIITGNDIYNFIEKKVFHKLIYESFSTQNNKINFEKYNVTFETFEFELKEFYDKLKL